MNAAPPLKDMENSAVKVTAMDANAADEITKKLAEDARSQYFSCRGLNAYYGDSYIVQNVSLDVK